MGQQQLLMLGLTAMVVILAISIGLTVFASSSIDANRNAVISDLVLFGTKAQRFFRTSVTFRGGNRSFDNFYLSPVDTGNANGSYSLTTSLPSGNAFVPGSDTKVSGSSGFIYIVGCGIETGDDDTNPVKAFSRITRDSIETIILN